MTFRLEPSELLALFNRRERAFAGLIICGLADTLAAMTEAEVNAFGVVIAGQATGWMHPSEVTPENADAKLIELVERLADGEEWEAELEAGDDG